MLLHNICYKDNCLYPVSFPRLSVEDSTIDCPKRCQIELHPYTCARNFVHTHSHSIFGSSPPLKSVSEEAQGWHYVIQIQNSYLRVYLSASVQTVPCVLEGDLHCFYRILVETEPVEPVVYMSDDLAGEIHAQSCKQACHTFDEVAVRTSLV